MLLRLAWASLVPDFPASVFPNVAPYRTHLKFLYTYLPSISLWRNLCSNLQFIVISLLFFYQVLVTLYFSALDVSLVLDI